MGTRHASVPLAWGCFAAEFEQKHDIYICAVGSLGLDEEFCMAQYMTRKLGTRVV